jgi:hypothetical protein
MKDDKPHNARPTGSTVEEVRALARLLAMPIDFAGLAAAGVVRKRGAWYEVLDWRRLPENVRRRVQEVRLPNLVKFSKPFRGLGRAEEGTEPAATEAPASKRSRKRKE